MRKKKFILIIFFKTSIFVFEVKIFVLRFAFSYAWWVFKISIFFRLHYFYNNYDNTIFYKKRFFNPGGTVLEDQGEGGAAPTKISYLIFYIQFLIYLKRLNFPMSF